MTVAARTSPELESIRAYYGTVLASTADLRSGACCAPDRSPPHVQAAIDRVHPEVQSRFYGCGCPIPGALAGATVLDLGCGSGRDAYVLSQFVGERGQVIGVDMTPEQLEVATRYRDWHADRFGHSHSNVRFHRGLIEDLRSLGIEDESVDLVVSNCVFNLSPDKPRLFSEVFRVLRPGGELFFSDVFADRRAPVELREDPVLLGECLAGAMYTEDFRRVMAQVGCADARQAAVSRVPILDAEIERKIGMIRFTSRTFRAFKLDLEDRCEDYGQVATYRGTIEGSPHAFDLDDHHHFEAGRPVLVCGNTAKMLSGTRYAPHFRVDGNGAAHFGLFDCAPGTVSAEAGTDESSAICC